MPGIHLKKILSDLSPRLALADPLVFGQALSRGKWSPKEILGHLIDSAYNNHQRFMRGQNSDELVFGGYQQNDWVISNRYAERDSKEVIATFLSVHHHLAELLIGIPAEVLKKTFQKHNFHQIAMRNIEEDELVCLGLLAEDYLYHFLHHIRQIYPDFNGDWYLGYREASQHRDSY